MEGSAENRVDTTEFLSQVAFFKSLERKVLDGLGSLTGLSIDQYPCIMARFRISPIVLASLRLPAGESYWPWSVPGPQWRRHWGHKAARSLQGLATLALPVFGHGMAVPFEESSLLEKVLKHQATDLNLPQPEVIEIDVAKTSTSCGCGVTKPVNSLTFYW